jgi:hypothetical protein
VEQYSERNTRFEESKLLWLLGDLPCPEKRQEAMRIIGTLTAEEAELEKRILLEVLELEEEGCEEAIFDYKVWLRLTDVLDELYAAFPSSPK